MTVRFHPHARARLLQRGASEAEVIATGEHGERFPLGLTVHLSDE